LGSTGSIGKQTLDVIGWHPEQFEVVGLSAGSNLQLLMEQTARWHPKMICVRTRQDAETVAQTVPQTVKVTHGPEGLCELAAHPDADTVLTAVVGSAGLRPTLAAIEAGKTILLANKETLVTAGH